MRRRCLRPSWANLDEEAAATRCDARHCSPRAAAACYVSARVFDRCARNSESAVMNGFTSS